MGFRVVIWLCLFACYAFAAGNFGGPLTGGLSKPSPNANLLSELRDESNYPSRSRNSNRQRQEREQLYEAYNLLHTLAQVLLCVLFPSQYGSWYLILNILLF